MENFFQEVQEMLVFMCLVQWMQQRLGFVFFLPPPFLTVVSPTPDLGLGDKQDLAAAGRAARS